MGGDNAGYYILGSSIASGQGYSNIHTKSAKKHTHFSPGYPIIIATTILLLSDDIETIKKVNGLFLFLTACLLFFLIHHLSHNYHIAFITTFLMLLNFHILSYSVIMMSEIPFLFFSTLSLFLVLKTDFNLPILKNTRFWFLLLAIIISYYIRPTGIALIAAVGLILALRKKWTYLIVEIISFILLVLPWVIRNKTVGGSSYIQQLIQINPYRPELGKLTLSDLFIRIWENFQRYLTREVPAGTFNFIPEKTHTLPISFDEWILGAFILAIVLLGIYRLKEQSIILGSYILSTFGILLLWPQVWYGPRFSIPLIPIILFLFIYGLTYIFTFKNYLPFKINNHLLYSSLSICTIIFGIKSYSQPLDYLHEAGKRPYSPNYENYFKIAEWVNLNTPDSTIISCRKEQLFYLFSQKKVFRFKNTIDMEEQVAFLKDASTDYVVLEQLGYSATGRNLYPAIKRYPNKFKVIKHIKNPDTYLLKFSADLGYTGEWKNDQRSGYGTFVWESGLSFAGTWSNNVRNGNGILYYSDGKQLEGIWVNDKMHGKAVIKDKQGVIIERCEYFENKKIKIF